MKLIRSSHGILPQGWRPEQARNVLPLALKTELIMTGSDCQWQKFFELRLPESSHPQARELARALYKSPEMRGLLGGKFPRADYK